MARLQIASWYAVDLRVYGRGSGLKLEGFREAANAARRRYLRASGIREDIPGAMEAFLKSPYGPADSADATP
jgi:hypothetical protein